ncbi:uncharacterized protein LOC132701138 [Cylas formicarius]|uniref:uncharacterized protein LOC132701138 n=1 Tax=Cylas formicarius TaxID=197179 RepID=UPI002958CBD5|nr:uncharacterized protein LOC132701138 [Cylas formicarius]
MSSMATKSRAILDFIFAHAKGDTRPYLEVDIYGKVLLGLLDSGSSRTILGADGWRMLEGLCRLNTRTRAECTVANGQSCRSLGSVILPFRLRGRIDFWSKMGIIPDMFSGEWKFRENARYEGEIVAIQSVDSLTAEQRHELNCVLDRAFDKMDKKLGCTNLVELTIKTDSPPIKQKHYPLSPPAS